MPVVLPSLRCYFDADDVSNLYYHRLQHPQLEAVVRSVLLFLPYRRPVGGCLYLLLYGVFGLTSPLPYHVTGLIVFTINIFLVFWLFLRLTGNVRVGILACSVASVHGALSDIWYNFGTIYEMLALGLMLTSFHLYLFYLKQPGRTRWPWYCGAIAFYWLAVGGKEMAVTLPALLLAYEWTYNIGKTKERSLIYAPLLRLSPFFVVALFALVGRMVANPYGTSLYAFHFDGTMLDNLCRYLEKLFYDSFVLTGGQVLIVLMLTLGTGILLRNRHMVFGWFYFLISLSPVIALPRVSSYFLYLPMVGLGLYFGSLLVDSGSRLWRGLCRATPSAVRFRSIAAMLGISLCMFGMTQIHYARIRRVRGAVLARGNQLKQFEHQLFSRYPDFPNGTALLFLRKPHVDWTLHQTVLLRYGKSESELHVWAPPNLDFEAFKARARSAPESHAFDYQQGRLVELNWEVLDNEKIEQLSTR